MSYITNIYDKKINNLRLYFALLIHNHTIFDTIYRIAQELPFLYVDPEAKLKKLPEDLEPMSFLKDGQYVVSGDKIRDFGAYCDKKKEEESIAVLKAAREKEEKEARLKE